MLRPRLMPAVAEQMVWTASSFQQIGSMMAIDHANLARLDLNLLVALDALLAERSVTRAAARVGLGQSAMSHNLARLRALFGDELLTRASDGMRPTPRALALVDPVRVTLSQIQALVSGADAFDPRTAERTFRIGMPDSVEVLLGPSLLAHLRDAAPGLRLRLYPLDSLLVLGDLDADRFDLAIGFGSFAEGQMHHKRRLLLTETYLCMFSAERTGLGQVPVVAVGSHDTASAVVGVPAERDDFGYLSCGTWSLVGIEVDAPIRTEESRAASPVQIYRRTPLALVDSCSMRTREYSRTWRQQ